VPAGRAAAEALSVPDAGSPDDLAAALAIVVGAVVLAVIVVPLLLFGERLASLSAADRRSRRRFVCRARPVAGRGASPLAVDV